MANKHANLDALFTDIAGAIREKTGDTGAIAAAQIPSVIRESLQAIPSVTLISFTVGGTSYQAEEGMTWEEWVNSSYNTDGFTVNKLDSVIFHYGGVVFGDNGLVRPSDVITANGQYTE